MADTRLITVRVKKEDGGQVNVSFPSTGTLAELKKAVEAVTKIPASELGLYSARERKPKDVYRGSGPVGELGIVHGSLVYAVDGRAAASQRCKHAPQFTCLHCSKGEATGVMKCSHPEGVSCLICMPSEAEGGVTGAAKCSHGPTTRCINCTGSKSGKDKKKKKKKKKKAKAGSSGWVRKCAHPPSMRCPACLDGGGASEPAEQECTHPSTMSCPNCVSSSSASEEVDEDGGIRCPFHGPNGRCVHCMHGTMGQMPVIKNAAEASVAGVQVDTQAINRFAPARHDGAFVAQRSGLLFGVLDEDSGVVRIDYIYEPKQAYDEWSGFSYADDDEATAEFELVRTMSERLGRSLVGFIFTRAVNDAENFLRGAELRLAATRMAALGADDKFVTLTVSILGDNLQALAFQLTPLAVRLAKKRYFAPPDSTAYGHDVSVVPVVKDVKFQHSETQAPPAVFFYARIHSVTPHAGGLTGDFPVEHRIGDAATLMHVKTRFLTHENEPLTAVFADFHMLLFLAQVHLFETDDILHMCDAVRSGDAERLEGYHLILQHAQ
ncbi:uncharacterized protein AMSG_06175 [Thecamonas trahens ATCC 50062]|uniref:Nuclear pore localisation protein Npl4 ubiquitin-like domain-containing protein n=1 Tax=Thecamonas trahens ATCC 50062 TaxID=461836 RepID=A0A0L0DCN0_THETB|nr:hypothetical protein AMSG_06175 [Thecamonas trahens ATCC 50062]KNC49881.1 hypothetical protein AMSG_06175 [Thecamonas trahens ATCC 50062]|eukprot:XP_013757365.1 hypothetical protein AMSG_06175 [Thecamonas trahens ATCC 50062]